MFSPSRMVSCLCGGMPDQLPGGLTVSPTISRWLIGEPGGLVSRTSRRQVAIPAGHSLTSAGGAPPPHHVAPLIRHLALPGPSRVQLEQIQSQPADAMVPNAENRVMAGRGRRFEQLTHVSFSSSKALAPGGCQ